MFPSADSTAVVAHPEDSMMETGVTVGAEQESAETIGKDDETMELD